MADADVTSGFLAGCYACGRHQVVDPPPREDVLTTGRWRVAHAFNSMLPGWLVVLPLRHVTSYTELTGEEADELGGLLHRLAVALESVTGCVKTYLMQFSEAEGFAHLHVHLVPRMADQPADARGPKVFVHLTEDESRWLPEEERDAVALAVRRALERAADQGPHGPKGSGARPRDADY